MTEHPRETLRQTIRKTYAEIAKSSGSCCGPSSCCGPGSTNSEHAERIGYARSDIESTPAGAEMGLACGNPHLIAALQPGETVLDLGSGGGFDCLLATRAVGDTGRVIGVDMTPEMVDRARTNARKAVATNVEFRLGEIEHLPVADATVDVVISNCVVNLATDKAAVFREVYRVLKAGGRLAIADMVAREPLPDAVLADAALITGCLGGAITVQEIESLLLDTGFVDINIEFHSKPNGATGEMDERDITNFVVAATIEATKR